LPSESKEKELYVYKSKIGYGEKSSKTIQAELIGTISVV